MRAYIMHRGIFQKIPIPDIRNQATVFLAWDRKNLKRVNFFSGDYANDTELSKLEKLLAVFPGKLRIKVCGPAVFTGRPMDIVKIGGNTWGQGGDFYLKTEIRPGKAYCLSWIANYPDKDALCISFEIIGEGEEKK